MCYRFGLRWFTNIYGTFEKFKTCGFDINKSRVKNLQRKIDDNLEFKKKDFTSKHGSYFTFDKKIWVI